MPVLQRFFPTPEPDQIPWLNNYKNKIPTHGPTCGILAAELTATNYDLAFYVWLLETWNPAIQQDAQEATAYKKLLANGSGPTVTLPVATTFASPPVTVAPGVLKRLFNQIARLKLHTAYTETIGMDLQIIGAEDTADHPVPEFKLKIEDGPTCQCVRIDFTKFGHKAVYIEGRRNGGAWEFVAIDSEKPYIDARPLLVATAAETREYRLRFWNDGPDGDWSPVQKVTVGP